jgi:hypothetical protein
VTLRVSIPHWGTIPLAVGETYGKEVITTPAPKAPPLLNQEGSLEPELPSSDEEGWRAERRGGLIQSERKLI